MPSINVKMVKVAASDLAKNDIFTTVLRGDGELLVVTKIEKKEAVVTAVPLNILTNGGIPAPSFAGFDQNVRKVVGVKYVPARTDA